MYQRGVKLLKKGNVLEGIHQMVLAQRLDAIVDTTAPILNNIYKTMESPEQVAKYFAILDQV